MGTNTDGPDLGPFIEFCHLNKSLVSVQQMEIKNHIFFSLINWDDLINKKITPPFNPNVVSIFVFFWSKNSEIQEVSFRSQFEEEQILLSVD